MTGQVFCFGSFTEEETIYFQSQPLAGAHKLTWAEDRSFPSPAQINGESYPVPPSQPPTPGPVSDRGTRNLSPSPSQASNLREERDAPEPVSWAPESLVSPIHTVEGNACRPSHNSSCGNTSRAAPGAAGFGSVVYGGQQVAPQPLWPGPAGIPGHAHPHLRLPAVPFNMVGPPLLYPRAQAVGVPVSRGAMPLGIPLSPEVHATLVGASGVGSSPPWTSPATAMMPNASHGPGAYAPAFHIPGPARLTPAPGGASAPALQPAAVGQPVVGPAGTPWRGPAPWPNARPGPHSSSPEGGLNSAPLADGRRIYSGFPFVPSPTVHRLIPARSGPGAENFHLSSTSSLENPPPSEEATAASTKSSPMDSSFSPAAPLTGPGQESVWESSSAPRALPDGAPSLAGAAPAGTSHVAEQQPESASEPRLHGSVAVTTSSTHSLPKGAEPSLEQEGRSVALVLPAGSSETAHDQPGAEAGLSGPQFPAIACAGAPPPELPVPPHPFSSAAAASSLASQHAPSSAAEASESGRPLSSKSEAAPAAEEGCGPSPVGASSAAKREGGVGAEVQVPIQPGANGPFASPLAEDGAAASAGGNPAGASPKAWTTPRSWASLIDQRQPEQQREQPKAQNRSVAAFQYVKQALTSPAAAGGAAAASVVPPASPTPALGSPHASSTSSMSSASSAGWVGVARGSHKGPGASSAPGGVPSSIPSADLSGAGWQRSLREAEEPGNGFVPRGLINTGNLCFLNSTLQALLACPPFRHLLSVLSQRKLPEAGYPTLRAFAHFADEFESMRTSALPGHGSETLGGASTAIDVGRPFAPSMFDNVLTQFSPNQRPGARHRQEDAQEFLSFVMERMHTELLQLEGRDSGVAPVSLLDGGTPVPGSEGEEEWETVGPKNRTAITRTHTLVDSPLSDIFGGQLRSVVKTKGNKASATVQPFMLLQLDILPDSVHTVEDALQMFATPEPLDGYKAKPGRAEVVSASKAVKLQSLPRVLILHLMRFSFGANGTGKVHKPVHFPAVLTPGRDLLASPSGSNIEARKYELVASVSHHGKDPSAGHYTADARQPNGTWLRFDDNFVSVIPASKVFHDQAYLLLYRRMTK